MHLQVLKYDKNETSNFAWIVSLNCISLYKYIHVTTKLQALKWLLIYIKGSQKKVYRMCELYSLDI